jgi:hypothetical protein
MVSRSWKVYGPFELDKHREEGWCDLFRESTSGVVGLADAAGVYIIAVSNRQSHQIKYIGMTHQQGFALEIFSQRNRSLVWDQIGDKRSRCITIWLIAKPTPTGRAFSWDQRMERQSFLLETLFIMHAKAAGHALINTSKMKSADGIAVAGLFGAYTRGVRSRGVKELSETLKLQ